MEYEGFIGPAYRGIGTAANGDRLVNLYPEAIEVPNGKAPRGVLIGTPGSTVFVVLPAAPVKAIFEHNGQAFAVAGTRLYELFENGTYQHRGDVPGMGTVRIRALETELFIVHGANAYRYVIADTELIPLGNWLDGAGCSGLAMIDNYIIASVPNTRNFRISGLNDGASWNATEFGVKEGKPDYISTIFEDHRELWLFGKRSSEVWYNSGASSFPFQLIDGASMEVGIEAPRSIAALDNTMLWVGNDDRGSRFVWRAEGYNPVRVSNHAIERYLREQAKATVEAATAFTYSENGHGFYVLTAGSTTWVYDMATQSWHEREWWDSIHGTSNPVRGRVYCQAFGKHLTGDWENGNVYQLSETVYTDNGGPLRSIRRSPHIYQENRRHTIHSFEIEIEKGTSAPGLDPTMTLRASKDGGNTWGSELESSASKIGEHSRRVRWTRLGQARDFVFEVRMTDAMPRRWVNAYVEVS